MAISHMVALRKRPENNSSGYLVLGNAETVGANSDLFELLDREQKIYSKKGAAIRPFSHFAAQDLKSHISTAGYSAPVPGTTPADFQKEADRVLLAVTHRQVCW